MFRSRKTDTLQCVTQVALVAVAVDTDVSDQLRLSGDASHSVRRQSAALHRHISEELLATCSGGRASCILDCGVWSSARHDCSVTVAGVNAEEK
jgi:hypothetical protein